MRIFKWLGDPFIPRTFARNLFLCVSLRLIFPSSCIDYSATSAPSRGINGSGVSVKTSSTGATPEFLPKHETKNPRTFGPNPLTGGGRRSGSKSQVYAQRTPPVNCANESTRILFFLALRARFIRAALFFLAAKVRAKKSLWCEKMGNRPTNHQRPEFY